MTRILASDIRAGDVIHDGDECFPRARSVRCVVHKAHAVDVTFSDGSHRIYGREHELGRTVSGLDRYRTPDGIDWHRWADEHGEPVSGRGMDS